VDVFGLTSGVVQVSALGHACVLTAGGGVKCWGINNYGQLGDNSVSTRFSPVDVYGLSSGVAQIGAGVDHSCALMTTGAVKCWGAAGRLGDGTLNYSLIPVNVIGLPSNVVQISVGGLHTCVLTSSGALWCWGANDRGQVGIGSIGGSALVPMPVVGLGSGVIQVRSGIDHSCAVKTGGSLVCWGSNISGQLGNGTAIDSPVPVNVTGLSSGVVQVSGGGTHTCALMSSGGVKCWGSDGGYTFSSLTPINIGSLANIIALPDAFTPAFNEPPAVNAGGPYLGNEGTAIPLNSASASDPDDDDLTYSWSVNSSLCTFNDNSLLNPNLTCSDNGSFTATLEVSDGTEEVNSPATVTVNNVNPTASLNNNGPVDEGGSAAISFNAPFDPSSDDTLAGFRYAFDCNGGSLASATYAGSGTSTSTICAFSDNGSYTVSGKVMDKDGGSNESTTKVIVNNIPPTITTSGASSTNEGSPYSLTLGAVSDSGTDTVTSYTVHWGDGSSDSYANNGVQTHTYADGPNSYDIMVDLADEDGAFLDRANALSVAVDNIAPTLGAINVNQALVPVNTAINASASFTDPGTLDTHTADWDWGDGSTTGIVTQGAGSGSVNDSHSYSAPGVYTLRLTVTDEDGAPSNESIYQYMVVYDPNGGFVTGSGWINSPAGAYLADTSLTGRANFGFVSKYKNGATVPSGNTIFQFHTGGLSFHSTSYDWLVVNQNASNAQFKGNGTINGSLDPNGNPYKFMLWAGDGTPDTFRINIWWEEGANVHVVYDNGFDQAIGGGNIVVHKGN